MTFFNLKNIFSAKYKRVSLKDKHFWTIVVITLFFMFVYNYWPWRGDVLASSDLPRLAWLSHLENLAMFEFKYRIIGSLFLIPIFYATIIYKWRGALLISFLALIYSLLTVGLWSSIDSILQNTTILLLPALITTVITIELELHRKDKKIFEEREEERKKYVSKVLGAQEKERQRLARELHDGILQSLVAVASYSEALESFSEDNFIEMERKASRIKEELRNITEELRRINMDLRPAVLDNLGLIPALNWLTNNTKAKNDNMIQPRLIIRGHEYKLDSTTEVIIFRIIQEAIQNINRHSRASEASIIIEFGSDALKMTIWDNGIGFVPPKKLANLVSEGKLGLAGMQERIDPLGGNLQIRSSSQTGTSIIINIPVFQDSQNSA